jgi:hypothetical protein
MTPTDPLDLPGAVVDCPDGWRRVFRGAVKPDDMFLNHRLLKGRHHPLLPVEEPCEHCLANGKVGKSKYCETCLFKQLRRQAR